MMAKKVPDLRVSLNAIIEWLRGDHPAAARALEGLRDSLGFTQVRPKPWWRFWS